MWLTMKCSMDIIMETKDKRILMDQLDVLSLNGDLTKDTEHVKVVKGPLKKRVVNISGTKFEVSEHTYSKVKEDIPNKYLNDVHEFPTELFAERHPAAFQCILYYKQGGELHIPSEMCPSTFKREMDFWGVHERVLAKCCFAKYMAYYDDEKDLKILEADETTRKTETRTLMSMSKMKGWRGIQGHTWLVLNEPFYSISSKIYFFLSALLILLSIFALIAGTHSNFQRDLHEDEWKVYYGDEWDKYKHLILGTSSQLETEGGSEPETTSEPEAEGGSEPETTSEPEAEGGSEPETTSEPEAEGGSEPETISEPVAEVGSEPEAEVGSEPETTSEPEAEGGSEPETTLEPEAEVGSEPETTSEPEAEGGSEPETTSEPEAEGGSEPETTSEPEAEGGSEPETTSEPEAEGGSEPETTSEPEAEVGSEPETTSEPEAEVESESQSTSEPEITSEPETSTEPESMSEAEAEGLALPENAYARFKFLDFIEYTCIGFFTLDLIVRFIFCPFRSKLLTSFLNWVDIFSLVVMYLKYGMEYMYPKEKYEASVLDILHCLQVVRVFRLFRLVKNFIGFRVLYYAFKASFIELMLMSLFLMVATLLFSTCAYFSGDDNFPSIPDAFWWAIITMTTVGYGDIVPKLALSKCIGVLCAVSGVCLIAVVVPVFVNNFVLFYTYSKVWGKKSEIDNTQNAKIAPIMTNTE